MINDIIIIMSSLKVPSELISESLHLLSSKISKKPELKNKALSQLASIPDSILQIYLLQLVQAIRYDFDFVEDNDGFCEIVIGPLACFLIERSSKNRDFAFSFHWYVRAEIQISNKYQTENDFFQIVYKRFLQKLSSTKEGLIIIRDLRLQGEFISEILSVLRRLENVEKNQKTEKLKKYLLDVQINELVPNPLKPETNILSIDKKTAKIFPSHNTPAIIDLIIADSMLIEKSYRIMFKSEDLRQDQLCVSMIRMMNRLFLNEGLDLHILFYNIIATSSEEGFLEFIPDSWALSKIVKDYINVQKFFETINNPEYDSEGFKKLYRDTSYVDKFIKSCAGYTIMTYVLGLGDRHLDNIMVHKSGALFHIDFGYMFGRDPKPIKQDFIINREMIIGFGGMESSGFHAYRTYCWKAFNILRKNYYLIVNMLILMTDAKIPDLSVLQDSKKVLMYIRSRFKVHLSDEDAEIWLYENLNKNSKALGPIFMEYLHRKFSYSD